MRSELPYFDGTRAEFEEKLREGNELLKVRAKSRKHGSKVADKYREVGIKEKLWKEIEEVETAKCRYEAAQDAFKASRVVARQQAEATASAKIHPFRVESKKSGVNEFESLKAVRQTKRRKGYAYLLFSLMLLLVEPLIRHSIGSGFRAKIHEILTYSPDSIVAKMNCFGVEGYTIDFTTAASDFKPKCESIDQVKASAHVGTARTEYYIYNITNPEEVLKGATPVVNSVGPLVFGHSKLRKYPRFVVKGSVTRPLWLDVDELDFLEYAGEESLLDVEVTTLNLGLQELYLNLRTHSADENVFVAWLIASVLDEVVTEIQTISLNNPGISEYEIWAGVGAWSVSSTNCPCFKYDRSFNEDTNNCSATFGCFLFQENFQQLTAQGLQYSSYSETYLENLPVFDSETLSTLQAMSLWDQIKPSSTNCTSGADICGPLYDALKSSGLTYGAINTAELIKAFGTLWRHDEELPLLLGRNLVLFEEGINSNTLANFYITIRDSNTRCAVATESLGQLACTQLNDVMQYLHRLFIFKSRSYYASRNPAKGLFVSRSVREVLLTGYPSSALGLLAFGASRGDIDSSSSVIPSLSIAMSVNSQLALDTPDVAWVTQAWVPAHIRAPSRILIERAESSAWTEAKYARAPLFDLVNSSSTRPFTEPLTLSKHTYSTGFHRIQDIMFARYLGSIDDGVHDFRYGTRHYMEGFNGVQFGPSFDIHLTGQMFNAHGQLQSKLVDSHLWPQAYKVFDSQLERTMDYVFERFTTLPKYDRGSSLRTCEVPSVSHLASECQDDAIPLLLRRFTLANNKLPRFTIDSGLPTCMVNATSMNRDLPIYIGMPNYAGCNSTHGATPQTAGETVGDVVRDGFTQGIINEDPNFIPLPLDQRADVLGEEQFTTAIDIEPVSGYAFQRESALTEYFELQPSVYQFRHLPKGLMLPLFTRREHLHRSDREAEALLSLLQGIRAGYKWTRGLTSVLIAFLVCRGIVLLYAGLSTPELRRVASKCSAYRDQVHQEAYASAIAKHKRRLSKAKAAYEEACARYKERKEKLEQRIATTTVDDLADSGVPLKGLSQDGKVFEFNMKGLRPEVIKR